MPTPELHADDSRLHMPTSTALKVGEVTVLPTATEACEGDILRYNGDLYVCNQTGGTWAWVKLSDFVHLAGDTMTGGLIAPLITSTGDLKISSTAPRLVWIETDAGTNATRWHVLVSGGVWKLQTSNDADNSASDLVSITRSGLTPVLLTLVPPVETTVGARILGATTPGSGAGLELGYASNTGNLTAYDRGGAAYKALTLDASSVELRPSGTTQCKVDSTGVIIGGGNAIKKILTGSASWDIGITANNATDSTTLTVTGATTADVCLASVTTLGAFDWLLSAHVQAADTVRVMAHNVSGADRNPNPGTVHVTVFQH